MDWEYQSSPLDQNSPFTGLFAGPDRKNEKNKSRPHPFPNLQPPKGTQPPPFRNPAFSTPRSPLDGVALSEVASAEEHPGLTKGGEISGGVAARVKNRPKPQAWYSTARSSRKPAYTKRRKRVLEPSPEFSDADKKPDLPDSSSESTDVSDFQQPDNGAAREATSIISAKKSRRSNRESEWDQITLSALAILTAIYIGGSFYYKVVSVSILAVWIYSTLMFPTTDVLLSGKRQSRRLGKRFRIWVRNFAKLVGLLVLISWCVMLSPIHIFVPTPMDAWTRYSDHPTFRSFEVLHDPGDSGIVE